MTQQAVIRVLLDRYGRTYAEGIAGPVSQLPHLAAALVRVSLTRHAADELMAAA
jgi:hypothetical protein